MLDLLRQLFASESLAPHGMCLTWRPELIWTHVVADGLIGAAYFSIPLALAAFVVKRRDVTFSWMFWCFALFILACGTTHFFSIWTLWSPDYGVEAVLKAFTALVSITTAAALWPLLPAAIALPSPGQLAAVNAKLEARIAERDAALEALRREIAEREKAQASLRQIYKLEAMGQLTGGVAHDFNNLLAATYSSLELLDTSLPATDTRSRRLVANARAATERGAALTKRLLAFARKQELAPAAVDVGGLVEGMRDLLQRSLGPTIVIETRFPGDLPAVLVDANQLELALVNLAVNARDAMPDGGTLTIDGEVYTVAPGDESGLAAGDYVQLCVTDTGIGMDAETAARAAEPFYTTKDIGKGTGLGLSSVHGLAAQSGGDLRLSSTPGEGTQICIRLPIAGVDARPAPAFTSAAAPAPAGAPLRILLVDDDALVREGVEDMAVELGHSVVAVGRGSEAIARLEADGAEAYDLLVTDLAMPGMTGVQLAETVGRRWPGLRILLMTGYGESAGPWPRLGKPFFTNDLARALAGVLAHEEGTEPVNSGPRSPPARDAG